MGCHSVSNSDLHEQKKYTQTHTHTHTKTNKRKKTGGEKMWKEREEHFQLILDNYHVTSHDSQSPHYLNTDGNFTLQGSRRRTI